MIKRLDKSYLKEIMKIHEKTIFLIWDEMKREYNINSIKKFVNELLDKRGIYGYFDKNELVGVLALNIRNDKKAWVEFILILPEFQGKGISKELMKFAEEYFFKKNIKNLVLDVLIKNKRAINFYKKIGYKITKKFKKDGVFKYIMEKKIK